MASYEGGFTGAVNAESQRAQQAASAQHLMAMVRAAALAEQTQQRQRAAGGMAFNALSGAMGGGIPPPPGVPGGGPQAPMPGTNSQAQMAPPPVQAPPQQAAAPAPQAAPQQAPPPPLSAGGPAPGPAMPQPIPPFRPLPSAPPASAPVGPDGIPPPPAALAPAMAAPAPERQVVNLPSIIQALNKGQGTPEEKMEALNALRPVLNEQQTQELKLFQAQTGALKAANEAYRKEMDLMLREAAEDRKGRHGDRRLDINQQNADTRKADAERRLNAARQKVIAENGNDGARSELTPGGLAIAEELVRAGVAIPGGWSKAGMARGNVILNEMARNQGDSAGDGSIVRDRADSKSSAVALTQVSKDLAAIRPYKEMLDMNVKVAKDLAKKAIATDMQIANKPINWLRQNMSDNPDVAEYLAQMRIVSTEAARVLNNPRLVGQLTDSARHEMAEIINGNMPLNATNRVLDRMTSDGKNRVDAMVKEATRLKSRVGRRGSSRDPEGGAAPRADGPEVGTVENGYRFIGGDAGDRASWEKVP